MSGTRPPMWAVLRAHFRADPRKTGILIALVVVMVVVYARLYHKSGVPSEAEAAVGPVADGEEDASPAAGGTTRKPAPARLRMTLPDPLLSELGRNPFAIDLDKFPRADGATGPASITGSELVENDSAVQVRDALGGLMLEATICGDGPMASINGQVVRPGQAIGGFVVERVEPTRVILRRDGIEVTLHLK